MEKLLEALKSSLSADQLDEVKKAVEAMVSEAREQIDQQYKTQYDEKVNEAYATVAAELETAEAKADEGYKQAQAIIEDQNLRIETLRREYEDKMDEGYQQAWEMIEAEQSKRQNVEVEVYSEANNRLKSMRDFMVEKLDQFLQLQNAEIYESARRDVLNDPKTVEHRVALEKMAEIMSDYLSVEETTNATSAKLQETCRQLEDMHGRIQILEHRNLRLSDKNKQLAESVRGYETQLNESRNVAVKEDRKNRTKDAEKVSGRGKRVIKENEEIIPEFNNPVTKKSDDQLVESSDLENEMLVLAGLQENE